MVNNRIRAPARDPPNGYWLFAHRLSPRLSSWLQQMRCPPRLSHYRLRRAMVISYYRKFPTTHALPIMGEYVPG
jgi:hypothetical protein